MASDGIARYDPDLVHGSRGRQHGVPEVAVVVVGSDIQTGIIAGGGCAPRRDLDDRINSVDERVLAHELAKQAVVARCKPEAPTLTRQH